MDVLNIQKQLEEFAVARDWNQFHSPKNLAMALSVEASELLEQFQWKTEAESTNLGENKLEAISKEIADVQIYLLRLADKLNIDVEAAVQRKLAENKSKYPAAQVRGSAAKYTEYE